MRDRFGPWATALDTEPGAALDTFWQNRMAMLPILNRTPARVSHRARIGLVILAAAATVAPLVSLSPAPLVRADDPAPGISAAAQNNAAEIIPVNGPAQGVKPAGAALGDAKNPAVEFLPPVSPTEQAIVDALEQPTEMDFVETPLQDVVDYLKSLHHIEIQLDAKSLEESSVGSDTPVTRSLKQIPLRSALRLLLGPLDLTHVVSDDILLITTKEHAATRLTTRTYPVGDLIDEKQQYDGLVEAIVNTMEPESWDEAGGAGAVSVVKGSKSLVVLQTYEVHDKILQLLRSLRAAQKTAAAASK